MRRWWMMVLFLGLAPWGWTEPGETLALTVHTQNADPGEAGVDFVEQYFVDGEGRLVREVLTRRGAFVGDPESVEETQYQWQGDSVRWEKRDKAFLRRYSIDRQGPELLYHLDATSLDGSNPNFVQDRRIHYIDGPGTQWVDDTYRYSWSRDDGFQQYFRRPDPASGVVLPLYTTSGARLSRWFQDNENTRLLLNRTPQRLLATFVAENENLDGWIETGQSQAWGRGLWTPDPLTNLTHSAILDTYTSIPLWIPFLFERKYLR